MYEWNGAGHMVGMWFWWIFCIAIIAAVIWAIVITSSRTGGNSGASAEDLLKRRYANGEVDKDAYEKHLHDLRQ